jgi:hypothetical protein
MLKFLGATAVCMYHTCGVGGAATHFGTRLFALLGRHWNLAVWFTTSCARFTGIPLSKVEVHCHKLKCTPWHLLLAKRAASSG